MGFHPFKSFTLRWWEVGLFKVGMLSIGLAVGACGPAVFAGYTVWVAIFAAVALVYITTAWFRQQA